MPRQMNKSLQRPFAERFKLETVTEICQLKSFDPYSYNRDQYWFVTKITSDGYFARFTGIERGLHGYNLTRGGSVREVNEPTENAD